MIQPSSTTRILSLFSRWLSIALLRRLSRALHGQACVDDFRLQHGRALGQLSLSQGGALSGARGALFQMCSGTALTGVLCDVSLFLTASGTAGTGAFILTFIGMTTEQCATGTALS